MKRLLNLSIALLLTQFVIHGAPAVSPNATSGFKHYPVTSRTHIAFVYAEQIWVAPRNGGPARQLTDSPGAKYRLAFSPDGQAIAFTATTHGNTNLYTVAVSGGRATQVTHLPAGVNLCQWSVNQQLLFYTTSLSFNSVAMQLFTVKPVGGLPVKLPVPYGSEAALSDDGEWLAYIPYWPHTNGRQARRRYLGGFAPDIWLFNLRNHTSKQITNWQGSDTMPMWVGNKVYYLSDAGPEHRLNIWSYDITDGARRQITTFAEFDISRPSLGPAPGEIVFQYGAGVQLLDIASGKTRAVEIAEPEAPKPSTRVADAGKFITASELSPAGDRVLFSARGDVWVRVVGSDGPPRNITSSSGAFERDPTWSPNGSQIAYFSDESGEYELHIRNADGSGAAQKLTTLGPGFRIAPQWSPDGKKIAFTDATGVISVVTLGNREINRIDKDEWGQQPQFIWSPDSERLAYTKTADNRLSSVWMHNFKSGTTWQVSSGLFNDNSPVFDPMGKSLFFVSSRNISSPVYDPLSRVLAFSETDAVVMVPIDASREAGATVLPASRGNILSLSVTADGNPIYAHTRAGGQSSIRTLSMSGEKKEELVVIDGYSDFQLSADGRKLLIRKPGEFAVIAAAANQKVTQKISTEGMSVNINQRAEWQQTFNDTWRLYRDLFYSPEMHGVDWSLMRQRYGKMLEHCLSREDVNYVISEMIAELNASHAWISNPGDVNRTPESTAATVGADFKLENGAYRIVKLYEGAPWKNGAPNPLVAAGVKEGEYVLAVNGTPLDITKDPWAAFQNTANTSVTLKVSSQPRIDSAAREVVIKPLPNDFDLRYRDWVESNRAIVDRLSNGQVGYLHIPDFAFNGYSEFIRQFQGQIHKKALIIDPRWSQGGSVGDLVVRMLAQPPLNNYAFRFTENVWPATARAHQGPKVVLINHFVISAGENFSYYFRKSGLGKLVGQRTWGGLVGLNGNPSLIDGGYVNIPNAPFFSDDGEWLIENKGVEPDIEVVEDPALMVGGNDPQLEAAVKLMLDEIKRNPRVTPRRPPYRNRIMMTPEAQAK